MDLFKYALRVRVDLNVTDEITCPDTCKENYVRCGTKYYYKHDLIRVRNVNVILCNERDDVFLGIIAAFMVYLPTLSASD
jgi:hypothetical protein